MTAMGVAILLAVFIAPIMEEFVFRGMILNRLIVKIGVQKAVIISSIIFGALHGEAIVGASLFGVVMGLLYLHTQSLWAPILLHVANNAVAVMMHVATFDPNATEVLAEFRSDYPYYLLALLSLPGIWFFLHHFWVKEQALVPYEMATNDKLDQRGNRID